MNVYLRVLQYYKPFIPLTVFGLFISLLGIGINLLKPWPLKVIIDSVLPLVQMAQKHGAGMEGIHLYDIRYQGSFGKDFSIFPADISLNFYQMVFFICAALVVIFFVSGILNFVSNYILVKIGLKALLKIRTELYACLQSLPLKFHDQRRSGDSTFRVAYDSQAIQSIFNKGFTGVFASVFTLIGTFAVMWNMNVKMTLLSLVILPLVVGTIYFFADRIRRE
ncbi:MAG: ABC transporter transmembrane domain-containing protein, partial [Verrucomicrobiae bacterium]|nr:ABC transporter transmembrane domain-containing protein [Verrucomicrobiae bacterium]